MSELGASCFADYGYDATRAIGCVSGIFSLDDQAYCKMVRQEAGVCKIFPQGWVLAMDRYARRKEMTTTRAVLFNEANHSPQDRYSQKGIVESYQKP